LFEAALGLVDVYGWFAAIWAEANPTTTKANAAIAAKAIIILVFCICFITILPYAHRGLW
jgi:hypothetical protein